MPSYLVPFQVYRWECGDKVLNLRYLGANDLGLYAFYDLDQGTKVSTQKFLPVPESDVLSALGRTMQWVDDYVRNSLPKEAELDEDRRSERAARWAKVARIFERKTPAGDKEEPVFTDEIYFSARLFRTLVRAEARRQGCTKATQHYIHFWNCIRYGGDEYALTDHQNRCGAPDQPRSCLVVAKKSGARSADYYLDPPRYAPKDRFDPFWRRRTLSAIIVTLATSDPNDLRELLRSPAKFRELMNKQFCFTGGNMRVSKRRKLPGGEIPTDQTLERQGMAMVQRLSDQILPLLKEVERRSAGDATGIAHGKEIIADMDVTDFHTVRIMFVTDDESDMRELGAPRVVLAVVRGSDYIVGYYLTIGYERTDVYLNCLLSMFTDKTPRLQALGFDEPLEGMASGNVDVVLTDGGAGKSERARVFVLKELNADHAKTAPYYPQGKGNVEGTNRRIKDRVSSNLHLADALMDGVAKKLEGMAAAQRLGLQHGQGMTATYCRQEAADHIVFLNEHVFEQALVEAINEHNLVLLTTGKKSLTQNMFARGQVPTRLKRFREQQLGRQGDRAYKRSQKELSAAILRSKEKTASLLHGVVTLTDGGEYGGRTNENHPHMQALMKWERDERFKKKLAKDKPITIRVSSPPYGNFATWHTDDGKFLDLPPTPACAKLAGAKADRARFVAMHHNFLSDQRKAKQAEKEGKNKPASKRFSAKAKAMSDDIRNKRGPRAETSSRPRAPYIDLKRGEEQQNAYEQHTLQAGMPKLPPRDATPEPDLSLLASLDDDAFGLSELQSAFKKRVAGEHDKPLQEE